MELVYKLKNLVIAGIIIGVGTIILLTPPIDPDFGWHYKYGEYTVKNLAVLKDNNFSHTLPEYKWANSYWLSQVIMYLMYTHLGEYALSFILGIALCTIIYFLSNKYENSDKFIIMVFFAAMFYEFVVTVRPLYFSSILFIVFFRILLKASPKYMPLLPLIFFIWANLHADFIIGLAILLFHTVTEAVSTKKPLFLNLAIWVACVAVTFINPFGASLWRTLLLEINPQISSYKEFAPIFVQSSGTTLIASSILLLGTVTGKNKVNWYSFVLIASFLLGIKSLYFFRIFLLCGLCVIDNSESNVPILHKNKIKKLTFYATAIIVVLLIPFKVMNTNPSTENWGIKYKYPIGAINYLKTNPQQGKMFNFYDWGGFLVWHLPEYKTFVDGRMAAWRSNGKIFVDEYKLIRNDPKTNEDLLDSTFDKYEIGFILDKPQAPIIKFLINKRNWQIKYEDEYSIVIAKNYHLSSNTIAVPFK